MTVRRSLRSKAGVHRRVVALSPRRRRADHRLQRAAV